MCEIQANNNSINNDLDTNIQSKVNVLYQKLAMAFESPAKPSFPTVYRSHQVRQRVSPTIQTVTRSSGIPGMDLKSLRFYRLEQKFNY